MNTQKELHWQYREKPAKPFEDSNDLPFGRYQIITFSPSFPVDTLGETQYTKKDIHDSLKLIYGPDGAVKLAGPAGERDLSEAEKAMQIFCLQKMEIEEIYPLLRKITERGESFYFRFNRQFTPDPVYIAMIPDEDIPQVSVDEIYSNVYRNKFDYIYYVSA